MLTAIRTNGRAETSERRTMAAAARVEQATQVEATLAGRPVDAAEAAEDPLPDELGGDRWDGLS